MNTLDDIVEQNGGAVVTSIAFPEEGAVLTVEFPSGQDGVRVVKQIGVEYDGKRFGDQAFELFQLATELAFEVNGTLKASH